LQELKEFQLQIVKEGAISFVADPGTTTKGLAGFEYRTIL
jgi:hypothetical protein